MSAYNPEFVQDGGRLIPQVIDELAESTPFACFLSIPKTSNPGDGWRDISYRQFANAVNRTAHAIVQELGAAPPDFFPTIGYIGPSDVRYLIYTVAAIKAKYQAFFMSPRNSEEAQLSLLAATRCNVLYYASSSKSTIQPWLQKRSMKAIESPDVTHMLDNVEPVQPFVYDKKFAEGSWEPFAVLHTSGSTGLPKPIVVTQGTLAACDSIINLPEFHGCSTHLATICQRSKRIFSPMPLFHSAGVVVTFFVAVYCKIPVALGIADRPPSPSILLESLSSSGADSALLAPSIVEELSETDEGIASLQSLGLVIFGGGSLRKEAGDRLVQAGVKLMNVIGSTETSVYPVYVPKDSLDWEYFVFDDDVYGCQWVPTDVDEGVFRLVLRRQNKHPGLQTCFYTFPEAREWDTKDLYKRHPTLSNHWKYYGRDDDVIVFSNGEKLNPVTIEETIFNHPAVKGAVVFGQGRFQPGVLIELIDQYTSNEKMTSVLDGIWPNIQEANRVSVAHGRILRNFVLFTRQNKPLPRAGKGTIQRRGALALYSQEINQLYDLADSGDLVQEETLNLASEDTLIKSVSELFQYSLGMPELEPDADFFTAGMDSLQVINASRLLQMALKKAGMHSCSGLLENRHIYGHPTLRKLAAYLYSLWTDPHQESLPEVEDKRQKDLAHRLIRKYVNGLRHSTSNKPPARATDRLVVLTGSTGSLGSYLLDLLIRDPKVGRVVCLNRGDAGGQQRQLESSTKRGLSKDFGKVIFYSADLSMPEFRLGPAAFGNLLSDADWIIHNAWPVNFNIGLETFEPHIRGVRNLIDFAVDCSKTVPIAFVSSISSVANWNRIERVPEICLDEIMLAEGGYGLSKLVGGLILDEAGKTCGIPTINIRVGQIGGPLAGDGEWARQEWLPSLLLSSAVIGAIPASLGPLDSVSWVPVELAAQAILELGAAPPSGEVAGGSRHFHCVNPNQTSWQVLVPSLLDFHKTRGIHLEVVSLADWIDRVQQEGNASKNPALKLIDTYRAWLAAEKLGRAAVSFSVERTQEQSKTIRNMEAISPAVMQHWCEQWYRR